MKKAFEEYINSYKQICPSITEEEQEFIVSQLKTTRIEKGGFFLNEGKLQKDMAYVFKGLLRSYYVEPGGKKITIGFIDKGQYAADYPSFILQRPSKYFIEAIEQTTLVLLPYTTIQSGYKNYKVFENYGRKVAEQILIQKQDIIERFLFTNAEDRYLHFLENNKKLINRISLTDLASLLGIERQSLSRIRKKISL